MTGTWENKLRALAEDGAPWDIPARQTLIARLEDLHFVLDQVASEPGLTGMSGDKASESFAEASAGVAAQIDYLRNELKDALEAGNAQRVQAGEYLASLGSGRLSPGQEAVVRGAAIGTTLVLGPFSILAGEGAVQALNAHLSDQREKQAKEYYDKVEYGLVHTPIAYPPPLSFASTPDSQSDPYDGQGPSGPFGGPTGGALPVGTGQPFIQHPTGTTHLPPIGTPVDPPVLIEPPREPEGPVIDLEPIPDDYVPTPDGPTGGIGTLPGTVPGGGLGGGSSSLGGGGAAGLGSGLGAGLVAGAGGAAALRGLRGAGGVGAAGLGGVGAAPGRGGGLLGAAGGRGGAGGGLGVRGGGAAGGGMMGGGAAGAGAGARGAAGGGAGGRGTGMAGGGMAGGAGARGDRRTAQGQGLGGPIAERIEDDEDFGPRSESAGAGGRD